MPGQRKLMRLFIGISSLAPSSRSHLEFCAIADCTLFFNGGAVLPHPRNTGGENDGFGLLSSLERRSIGFAVIVNNEWFYLPDTGSGLSLFHQEHILCLRFADLLRRSLVHRPDGLRYWYGRLTNIQSRPNSAQVAKRSSAPRQKVPMAAVISGRSICGRRSSETYL